MKTEYQQVDDSHSIQEHKEFNTDTPTELSEHWTRYFVTELIGTFIATLMSNGVFFYLSAESILNVELSGLLFLAAGIAVSYFIGILIGRDANLNCAFTFALALCYVKPWKMVPIIIIAQLIGAISADATFYYLINGGQYEKDLVLAASFGILYPSDEISNGRCFVSTIIFMTILMLALLPVFAPELGGQILPYTQGCMIVGLIIFSITITSLPTGWASNPTTFFSAYIFMWMNGFPSYVFKAHNHYWWVVIVGPTVGVLNSIGTLIWYPVVMWNEPKNWCKQLAKVLAGPEQKR